MARSRSFSRPWWRRRARRRAGSLVFVAPLDEAGNPTPAWSLKVHVALVVVAATTLPAVATMVLGAPWLGLLVGAVSGIALTVGAGRSAARRLGHPPSWPSCGPSPSPPVQPNDGITTMVRSEVIEWRICFGPSKSGSL